MLNTMLFEIFDVAAYISSCYTFYINYMANYAAVMCRNVAVKSRT